MGKALGLVARGRSVSGEAGRARKTLLDHSRLNILIAASAAALLVGCGPGGKTTSSPASDASSPPANAATAGPTSAPTVAAATGGQSSGDTPLRPAGTTEVAPKDQTMAFLYYAASGQAPPLQDWADQDARTHTSDEFARKKKSDELLATYKVNFADAGKVGHLVIPIYAQLSEYDDKAGQFYIDALSPSRFLTFNYDGLSIRTEFTNGEKAQGWHLDPDAAAAAFKTNNSSHSISLTVHADIVGAKMDDGIAILLLHVASYDIATQGDRPLAHIAVDK